MSLILLMSAAREPLKLCLVLLDMVLMQYIMITVTVLKGAKDARRKEKLV
jgi:hypothetical protein